MDKIAREREILDFAKSALEELYGSFEVIPDQLDRPDAAIILNSTDRKKIGIEITSIDKKDVQQYLNDEKVTKDIVRKQLDYLIHGEKCSDQPIKKISISFPRTYIFDGAIKKADNYSQYMESGEYGEMILLAFSSYLQINDEHFDDYHKPWAAFLFTEKSFPFDKVIFVCKYTKKAVVVYDKSIPQLTCPQPKSEKELGITMVRASIQQFGKPFNINQMFDKDPHIPVQNKNKRKKKQTEKGVKKNLKGKQKKVMAD